MAETPTTVVYEADWSGFEREPSPRNVIRIDLHRGNRPDVAEKLQAEESVNPIYDYEVEMRKSVSEPRTGLRRRVKRIMSRANEMIRGASISLSAKAQTATEASREYYSDDERGSRRQKISGAVAGAIIFAGLAYLKHKNVIGGVADVHDTAHQAHQHEHVRQAAEITVQPGDNPWTISEAQLHAHGVAHPSDVRIAADDARLLKLNHISPSQATDLHVGEKLKLPKVW